MFDLMAVAYQADLTRVFTFMMAREASFKTYPEIDITIPHHPLSHHGNQPNLVSTHAKLNTYHMSLFAKFLQKLQATPDGDGSLLDHSLFLYGSGMSNGNAHSAGPLPLIAAGGVMGKGHRHIQTAEKTPLGNMWVTVAEKFDIEVESVGGSNGKVDLRPEPPTRRSRGSIWHGYETRGHTGPRECLANGAWPLSGTGSSRLVRRFATVRDFGAPKERQMRIRLGMWLAILALPATVIAGAGAGAGNPELVDAVKQGNKATVRALLKQRADVKSAEADGTTALHWAVQADDLEMTQLLVRAGANVNAANRFGVTPLSLAATNGNAALIEVLLKAGANAKTADPEGETVLMTAARTGRVDAMKLLLVNGADVNAKESGLGETALMWAANENNADAVALLIEAGGEVNARSAPSPVPRLQYPRIGMIPADLPRGGWTPLMYAARQGAIEAATKLAENGADLNLKDPAGSTALILAIINGNYDLAKVLLDKGADPNVADTTGMTPLYAAVDMHTVGWTQGRPQPKPSSELDSVDIAKALLAKGANPNSRLTSPLHQRVHSPWRRIAGHRLDAVHARVQVGRHDDDAAVARPRRGSDPSAEEPYDRAHDRGRRRQARRW